jgi:hypothetical protein
MLLPGHPFTRTGPCWRGETLGLSREELEVADGQHRLRKIKVTDGFQASL